MTKEILEKIEQTIKEIAEERKRNEQRANLIYKEIWMDILKNYKNNIKSNELFIYIEDYNMAEDEEKAIEIKNILIKMLIDDGFIIKNEKSNTICSIKTEKIISFAKADQNNNNNNKEIIHKMPITPFAETRRRK